MYIRKNVALDNPEVFADVPGYISVDTSNW